MEVAHYRVKEVAALAVLSDGFAVQTYRTGT
jgi:hypothetical protein